jgi:lysozyme
MNISERGLDLIKAHEKCRLTAYMPTRNDVLTIGWGHTGPDVQKDTVWTQQQADDALLADVADAELCVTRHVGVELTQFEFDALVSLVYNIGCGAFKGSTLLRLLNQGDYDGAAAQFPAWNHQNRVELAELTRRRAEERELFEATA